MKQVAYWPFQYEQEKGSTGMTLQLSEADCLTVTLRS